MRAVGIGLVLVGALVYVTGAWYQGLQREHAVEQCMALGLEAHAAGDDGSAARWLSEAWVARRTGKCAETGVR